MIDHIEQKIASGGVAERQLAKKQRAWLRCDINQADCQTFAFRGGGSAQLFAIGSGAVADCLRGQNGWPPIIVVGGAGIGAVDLDAGAIFIDVIGGQVGDPAAGGCSAQESQAFILFNLVGPHPDT